MIVISKFNCTKNENMKSVEEEGGDKCEKNEVTGQRGVCLILILVRVGRARVEQLNRRTSRFTHTHTHTYRETY